MGRLEYVARRSLLAVMGVAIPVLPRRACIAYGRWLMADAVLMIRTNASGPLPPTLEDRLREVEEALGQSDEATLRSAYDRFSAAFTECMKTGALR